MAKKRKEPQNGPSQADVIFNRASLALAKSQQLIASWLPPKAGEEIGSAKVTEKVDPVDQEIFTPTPELLGLGAQPEQGKSTAIRSADQKLRENIFGKRAARQQAKTLTGPSSRVSSDRGKRKHDDIERDSDEEEGRTHLAGKRSTVPREQLEMSLPAPMADTITGQAVQGVPQRRKLRTSYLDEVLATRSAKRKKKKNKKLQGGQIEKEGELIAS